MTRITVRVIDAYVYRKTAEGLRFLILKRAKTKIYEHLWQGVAGKIEAGEEAWEAALRELKEETGLEPVRMFVADHVSKFYEGYKDRLNLVPVFGIQVDRADIALSEEHCAYQWVTFREAVKTLVWSGQKQGLTAVHDMLAADDDRLRWSEIDFHNTKEE